jgi:lactoylglutathione lyase|nr:lactoylglutathione lyase [Kofleriaceae bacterium]
MRYLHTMIRVRDLDAALRFFCDGLGLREIRRRDHEQGKFTLVFLGDATAGTPGAAADSPQIELTHNWGHEQPYPGGRNFGHVAYEVDDIYAACQRLIDHGYPVCRPPRDGRMAFVRSPDLISVELLQRGDALAPAEPWTSMPNVGEW